ncbi:EscS/YscS/HrcS family type III secretion system export apparatus protein [Chelativorans salis]|uniref:Flagellar biosynthetic protein FliQ n=1 Tax=Chelativorans salis TaxID=2978478 RepID=A0ABT2LQK2_9HYPH|nr:flagellar biosynthetic protein FliQ [Chelativorans sp. EGI FJ00035]MCT7376830.1 flagellar biosynthetic protein FliQ [Chelativorans sp. EGI FJ00035]
MTTDFVLAKVQTALVIVLFASAPVIITALAVGLLVGLAQALTQIQDQSLPQTIKLVAVLVVILLFGPVMAYQIAEQASEALDQFPRVTR